MADEAIIAAAPDMVVMMRRDGTASEENHGTQRS
jgi:ABC-type hemin transport system substrate-binding protein